MKLDLNEKDVDLIQQALRQMFDHYMELNWDEYTETCEECMKISTLNYKITMQMKERGV